MSSQPTQSQSSQPSSNPKAAAFGPNEWLVDDIYQQYLEDPNSVDRAWWDFFADYQPVTTEPAADEAEATEEPPAPQVESAPAAPAAAAPAPVAAPAAVRPASKPVPVPEGAETVTLRGVAGRTAVNMESSLEVPTATSVRAVPAKLLIDNRVVINNHLARKRGGKISFTHIIGFALVKALKAMPEMNYSYTEVDGKPTLVKPAHIGLGLAIDVQKSDGTRQLVVPSIKACEAQDFRQFWQAYEDVVRKARQNKLTLEDYAGTTISLTNPGTIGTQHSVPRLMKGQGTIIGVGAMEYPAEYQGASPETMARLAVSKIMTLTSTYDHRIIQGAQSGQYLRIVHQLLLGENGFYDEIFESLRIPYEPVRWQQDISTGHDSDVSKTARVMELIHSYRVRGHMMADTDPLEYKQRRHPDLDVVEHGLTLWDLEREFATGGFGGKPFMTLRDILGVLRGSYCRTIGVEYMHIQDPKQRNWIQQRVEAPVNGISREDQLRILRRLNAAEAFETFLQTKYVGQKRFSLEGGESLIPLLDEVLYQSTVAELDEVAIGMAHRGRLNVLANIVGKSYGQIFREFEGNLDPKTAHGSGDVKYHLGAEGQYVKGENKPVKVTLVANPSHLEAVDPVLEGVVRAKQDIIDKAEEGFTVLPILVHGDAAFAGQGVVAETLNLSQLRGYRTGGTVHVVVNNQVGFTTAPQFSRSSVYCTDVARMIEAPIFHVNGDDPEAVVRVARLAVAFRQEFKKDVVIDLVCYRRRGHNEGDDPSMTQPIMYNLIDAKRSVRKLYTESLIGRGDITLDEAEHALKDYQGKLEQAFAETREAAANPPQPRVPVERPDPTTPVATALSEEYLKRIVEVHVNLPEGFTAHPRVLPQLQRRATMVEEGSIDWAMAETLAFGGLLMDGHPVRLAGQDSRRGTFVQRHHVLVDRQTGAEYTPLANLSGDQAKYTVYDSMLSEYAAVGFEYGYSLVRPEALVAWEAQFGDFADGAQTVLDEFISSGEAKWGQQSGVAMLLPHGYEGQGPDHSSARIERYLQLCAECNMTVAMPSLPSNYFHLLRWQVLGPVRRPLIVFTPKSMLRLKAAVSARNEFTTGTFQPVLPDTAASGVVDPAGVRRVLLSGGKVYYDLEAYRSKNQVTDTALLRVEQLYPLPHERIQAELAKYPNATEVRWVQEEPANQGPWPFIALNLPADLESLPLRGVSRPASASPAVGSAKVHEVEQRALVERAFAAE